MNKKKKIYRQILKMTVALILAAGIISFFENTALRVCAEDLKIENSNFRTEENSYMSVTDVYGITLFDEKTAEKEKELKEHTRNKETKINDLLFAENISYGKTQAEFEEEIKEYNLFEEKITEEKKKYSSSQNIAEWFMILIIVIMLYIIAGLLTLNFRKKKKLKIPNS